MTEYQKTTWIDQIIDPLNGEIIQQGTRFTAEKMNKIEQGIFEAQSLANEVKTGTTESNDSLELHLSESATETGKGHIQLATNAEILAGTDVGKAVSPATLEEKIVDYGNIVSKSASFTLSLAERNKVVTMTGTAAQTITIPANATVNFKIGTQITFVQQGTGTVTFAPSSGVALYSKDTKRTIDGQYASATLVKTAADTWSIIGALKT